MAGIFSAPVVLAHRGEHSRLRENTLDAFEAAVVAGAHGIEFDVRRTADDVLVVHHDDRLKASPRPFLSKTPSAKLPGWLPTLDAVLDWAKRRPKVRLDVEIKEPGFEARVVEMLRTRRLLNRSVLTSFYPDVLFAAKQAEPKLVTGFLTEESVDAVVEVAVGCGAQALILPVKNARPELVALAQLADLRLGVWGVSTPAQVRRLVSAGVAGLITDSPARVLAALPRAPARRRKAPSKGRRGS